MSNRCLYTATFSEFLSKEPLAVLGALHNNFHGDALTTTDEAWMGEIEVMQQVLEPWKEEQGQIVFEYDIPRLGKRIDVVLLLRGMIFCLEFKVGKKEEFQSIFRRVPKWQDLWFYQKSEVLYQMTFVFCERFLPKFGDRTVDQMLQAARSGKQNIVEGSEDGKTSTEMELKLLNVARSSIGELRQDYEDFLKSRNLHIWTRDDTRFQPMQEFTKTHNTLADYEPFFQKWNAEEMANVGLTLCYQVDTMMNKYMEGLERAFVTQGGIKERMHQARTGYRQQQDERLAELEQLVPELQQQLAESQAAYQDLKQRALKAYDEQQAEIERLKKLLESK